MAVYNKEEKPPEHILKKGDIQKVKEYYDNIDNVGSVLVGGLTGGVVDAIFGDVSGLVANDVIHAIGDDPELDKYTKKEIKRIKKETKTESLAKEKPIQTADTWFGECW